MKNFKTIAIAFMIALGATSVNAQTKKVDTKTSQISWVGKKVTGQHSGTVNLKDGALEFKSGKLTGGAFTVDMNSIAVTDLKAGEGKEKLEGHLKADDFFGTAKFPTASLKFKTVTPKKGNSYAVTADLTIKGITKPVTFDIVVMGKKASTEFKVDRTKYGIEYKSGSIFSGLGDAVINDEFELSVALNF
ncbi:YceI family protein [Flavobacterium pallidum]|uniref:YceI family protein n=1 Tax=Flavobacterium pallidum TaxID=2172098 RepID=A0A2S1SI82_9FLAO|nr:YceI family protein [Flavobacterium pallidum]AWI26095.1 YceI family protein [Flavobacterium pallidum]